MTDFKNGDRVRVKTGCVIADPAVHLHIHKVVNVSYEWDMYSRWTTIGIVIRGKMQHYAANLFELAPPSFYLDEADD